jgi:putative salt-induced outer membrane protein YdiY
MRSLFALVTALFSLFAGPLHGEEPKGSADPPDQLRFSNGDRLTGELIRQDDEVIVFASLALGEITVPRSEAVILSGSAPDGVPIEALVGIAPIPPSTQNRTEENETIDQAAPSPAEPESPPPSQPSDTQDSAAKIAADLDATPSEKNWVGDLEFGLRQQQGSRDIFALDIRGSAERSIGDNDLRAKARLLYGEQDGQVNNDRYDASFQWRRELGERTFAQSLTTYLQDDLKDINRNWEQNFGAGYRVFDNDDHVVNIGAGLTGQYREASLAETGFFTLVEFFQDYTYRFNKRITIRQNAQAQYSPEGGTRFISVGNQPSSREQADNYKVRFNTVLQGKLTDQLSMNLRFEFEYDNAVRSALGQTDQRIITSLGYAF